MTHISKALLFTLGLALAACTSPGQFDNRGNTVDLNNQPGLADPLSDPTSAGYFSGTIGDRVLFAVDESSLTPEARGIVAAQATWLLDNRDFSVVIEGHADEQGTREYNLALGARRASAVQQFLIAQGVEPSRLRTLTYGKERPIEICSQEACYAKNRRSVTVLQAGIS